MSEHNEYTKLMHDKAVGTMKAHGIISIIFGALGAIAGILFSLSLFFIGSFEAYNTSDVVGVTIYAIAIFAFWVLPHIFFIVAGAYMLRNPSPKLAKGLIITNLVLSVFWNLVILILAIINLTQIGDYERGYKKSAQ
jgi:hypothetical protein